MQAKALRSQARPNLTRFRLSFDSLSTLLSAIASLISVGIAAYLVIEKKRESPDIRFISVPLLVDYSDLNRQVVTVTIQLLFQNVGARAGSLIDVKLTLPLETDSGFISGSIGGFHPTNFPVVIRPYAATTIEAVINMKGENPNVKTLLANLKDEARIGVRYSVSTKPKKTTGIGIEERSGYFPLIYPTEPRGLS